MKTHNLFLRSLSFALLIGFASSSAHAQENECNLLGDRTIIYFINGIGNDFSSAQLSLQKLKKEYISRLEQEYPNQIFDFHLSYNYSEGFIIDLWELTKQKSQELQISNNSILQLLLGGKNNIGMSTKNINNILVAFKSYIISKYQTIVDSSKHTQKFRSDLLEGRRVFLVPHSQGNLFANSAVSNLLRSYEDSIGMVGVASIASKRVNNQPYWTANDDLAINALRTIYRKTLPGNIDNDPGVSNDGRDFNNHNFIKSYLDPGLPSRSKIFDSIKSAMGTLKFPTKELSDGVIKVTLEWDNQTDVNLHIYEPDGSHVYYRRWRGSSGVLDRDDTNGHGPEHYFVNCDTLQTGTYRVGVNYFRGSGPVTANIQITTGDGRTKNYTRRLTSASFGGSADGPIMVARIVVANDKYSDGAYTFTVREFN